MFPPWLLTAFYVVSGVAVVWLLLRLRQKQRLARMDRREPPPKPAAPQIDRAPATSPAASSLSGLSILKASATPPEPAASPSLPKAPVLSTAAAARTQTADAEARPTWHRDKLFGDIQPKIDPAARVLAEDTPVARSDDFVFGEATPFLASMLPDSAVRREETRSELISAGYYQPHALQNLSAVRYAMMMGALIVGLLLLLAAPQRLEWMAMGGLVILPLLGWALPRLFVRGQAADRRSEIERGMPDLLDMLNMCVSQGLTVQDAMKRILRELRGSYPALAQELRIVSEQASIGNMHQALENFSRRLDIPEVHSFTSLLTQTERMGTSISEALTSYSDTMRESLRQRADEKGNAATFQLLFPTVLCLMPAVYLFLLGPAIIDLSNFFTSGGRDALDNGSRVIQQMNANRRASGPTVDNANP